MSLLLMPKKLPTETTKNKTGIKAIFERAMAVGEKVTLEQAIAILRAGW